MCVFVADCTTRTLKWSYFSEMDAGGFSGAAYTTLWHSSPCMFGSPVDEDLVSKSKTNEIQNSMSVFLVWFHFGQCGLGVSEAVQGKEEGKAGGLLVSTRAYHTWKDRNVPRLNTSKKEMWPGIVIHSSVAVADYNAVACIWMSC